MNDKLIDTLRGFRSDPSLVVELYSLLFHGQYWALVADATVPLESMAFLTYPSSGDVRELPIFTSPAPTLSAELQSATPRPQWIHVQGEALWVRMLDVTADSNIQVAVDPGEAHGIRLRRDMMLGMVGKYGKAFNGG